MELGAIPTHRPAPKKSAALAKLQKAVKSKKFDFIKHVMKQFERIREERAAEAGHSGAATAQEPMSALAKRRASAPFPLPRLQITMRNLKTSPKILLDKIL
jgi:hypothetical protein